MRRVGKWVNFFNPCVLKFLAVGATHSSFHNRLFTITLEMCSCRKVLFKIYLLSEEQLETRNDSIK